MSPTAEHSSRQESFEPAESSADYLPETIASAITLLLVIATSLLLLASDASADSSVPMEPKVSGCEMTIVTEASADETMRGTGCDDLIVATSTTRSIDGRDRRSSA